MRSRLLTAAVLGLSMLSGCTSGAGPVGGEAAPAGSPVGPSAAASTPGIPGSSAVPTGRETPAGGSQTGTSPSEPRSEIRRTDWQNVSLGQPAFLSGRTLRFQNGRATVGGTTCTMLPGGADPVYGHFLTEEPANRPTTEDALVLVECEGDQRRQTLLMVQIGHDQKSLAVNAHISADPSGQADRSMTFLGYSLDEYDVVVTVRKADGSTERRRYRHNGGSAWVRG